MSPEFDYSRTRFALALKLLTAGDPSLLRGPDTLPGRLRTAVQEVHSCTRKHFARNRDYLGFTGLMNALRARSPTASVLDAIPVLSADECTRFVSRLMILAQSVVAALALIRLRGAWLSAQLDCNVVMHCA